MHPPLFVVPLSADQSAALRAGLRSPDAFTARRCQIVRASARGVPAKLIAQHLGCSAGTARNAIRAWTAEGPASLQEKSSRPKSAAPLLPPQRHDDLRALLHQSPRSLGKNRSTWTLALVAAVCHERGWTPRALSIESVRHVLARLKVSWQRAKHWITSPDPAYARKKGRATG
ncbi:MAG: helix-turn-helix domain-containing protein [Mycobacteriales bacterium]